jgi:beta-galactosidase
MLKEMGVNALRTSHNPPAPEFLYFADALGFIVMDEAFDTCRVWLRSRLDRDR